MGFEENCPFRNMWPSTISGSFTAVGSCQLEQQNCCSKNTQYTDIGNPALLGGCQVLKMTLPLWPTNRNNSLGSVFIIFRDRWAVVPTLTWLALAFGPNDGNPCLSLFRLPSHSLSASWSVVQKTWEDNDYSHSCLQCTAQTVKVRVVLGRYHQTCKSSQHSLFDSSSHPVVKNLLYSDIIWHKHFYCNSQRQISVASM